MSQTNVLDNRETQDRETRKPVRLSLNISPEVAEALNVIAARRGTSLSDVIRDAVSLEKFLDDAHLEGENIVLRRQDNGKEREIVWSLRPR